MRQPSYAEDWTSDGYSDRNLRRMCDEGIERYRTGTYDQLHFDVYNGQERDVVTVYMGKNYADVPFTTHRLFK